MYRYNKYITKHLIHSVLLITFSLTSIVWLTQALRFIDFIVNQGVSIAIFLKLTILLIPSLVVMILPPAMLIAVLFVYHKLRSDSELIVLLAAGVSKWRLVMPAVQVGLGVTVLGYVIALYLQPLSYANFRQMQMFLRNNYVSILLQEGVFSNPVDGLTVFIRERDKNNVLHGILVHDNRSPDMAVTMMAEAGRLVETPQGPRFLLENGNRQERNKGRLSFLNFKSYTFDISLYTKAMKQYTPDPQELYINELFTYDSAQTAVENQKRFAEGHQRILWPAYSLCLILVGLAAFLSGEFNRRGQWHRLATAIMLGTMLLFSAIGLRGLMSQNVYFVIIAYLNLLIPIGAAYWLLMDYPGRFSWPKIEPRRT